jgi:uncharacterized protein
MIIKSQKQYRRQIIVGITGTVLLLFFISLIGSQSFLDLLGLQKINGTVFFISRLLYWTCLLLLFLYSIKIEKQHLLIWEERKYKLLRYVISMLAIFAVLLLGGIVIHILLFFAGLNQKSEKLLELVTLLKNNRLLLVFTALTAGIVEELIFRGYMLPRMVLLFKIPASAIAVSSLLFGLMHYRYGTVFNVVGPVFIGTVFAFYYWKFRNIKLLIACHFLWDLVSLLLLLKIK